jgi:hypothetical protein
MTTVAMERPALILEQTEHHGLMYRSWHGLRPLAQRNAECDAAIRTLAGLGALLAMLPTILTCVGEIE